MMPEARSAGARVQTSCVYQGCSACFLPACWWPLPFFFVVEATGELGGFSESQLMAHHILNFVEAAHFLCGVEVSPPVVFSESQLGRVQEMLSSGLISPHSGPCSLLWSFKAHLLLLIRLCPP